MARCVIVTGGDYGPIGPLEKDDFVLACDRGLAWCSKAGVVPQLLLGDFDSLKPEEEGEIPVLRYPVEKDDTDTMLAVRWAAEHGYDEVRLYCALGGSLDHLLANLQTLHFAVRAGLKASAADARTELQVLDPGEYRFAKHPGWKFSVLALTDRVEGLSIAGSKYDVENVTLTNSFPLGVGNDFKEDITLSFRGGTAAVLLCNRES